MGSLRHHLRHHRWLALWLVGLTLLMRIVVPAGFMPIFSAGAITITLCSGHGPMTMAMPRTAGASDQGEHQGKTADMRCPFAGLAMPGLAGADPALLAVAIAFVMALGCLAVTPRPVPARARFRPPAIGPPA